MGKGTTRSQMSSLDSLLHSVAPQCVTLDKCYTLMCYVHCTVVTLLYVIHFTILTALCYNAQCTFVYFTVLDARIFMLCSIDVVQIQILYKI